MYHTMILFKTNGPVKIHIQWTITKSMYSRLQLWLVLRTVVVTSACLIPSFHCPSSRWISPRMLWNIKEKRVRFTTESELSFITRGNHFYRFIQWTCIFNKDLIKDLITEIHLFWHIDNIIGTHGGKRRVYGAWGWIFGDIVHRFTTSRVWIHNKCSWAFFFTISLFFMIYQITN